MDEAGYLDGLKSALDILRSLAKRGGSEASIIVDRATGQHLDFQIGTSDAVAPDWNTIPAGARVTVLHTHPSNIAFGPEDWDVLTSHAPVAEIWAVCLDETYGLSKPADWEFQAACRPGLSVWGLYLNDC